MSYDGSVYCKAPSPDESVAGFIPGETILLTWLNKFLQQQHQPQEDVKPIFRIILTDEDVFNSTGGEREVSTVNPVLKGAELANYMDLPDECRRVMLPCSSKSDNLVRSGVTSLSRWMILTYHRAYPDYGFNHLLGYKETCFKACAEVSKWTMFVTTHLVPLMSLPSDTEDYQKLLADTLKHLEGKLTTKQPVSAYKHNYFKKGAVGSLRELYHILHNKEEREKFLSGHLPNLIDLLCYVTLQTVDVRSSLGKYEAISRWYDLMTGIAGISEDRKLQNINHPPDTNSCEISELLGSVCLQTVNHQTATQTGSKSPSNRSGSRDSKENESKSPKEPENRFTKEDKPCTDVIGNCEMNGSNKLTDADLVKKLRDKFHLNVPYTDLSPLSWDDLPHELDPARGGKLPMKRAVKKRQQLENMYHHIRWCILHQNKKDGVLVDFCAGGGHVGLLVAHFHPDIQVHLVENKEESLVNASQNITTLGLSNVTMYQCNLTQYLGRFDIGVTLHACGLATDLVIDKCISSSLAAMVISPCCYGTIHSKDSITLPRSDAFQRLVNREEMILLRHSSDKTERGIEQQSLGKECMVLADTDRVLYISQLHTEKATIHVMNPDTCSPKNHMITVCKGS